MKEFFDNVIRGAKALILLSIAIFFVRCSFGSLVPDINIQGLEHGDEIKIDITENEERSVITIRKNGKELLVIEDDNRTAE
jgi:hypothetical protein